MFYQFIKNNISFRGLLVFSILFFLVAAPALAKGLVPCGDFGEPECNFCHFFALIQNVIDFLIIKLIPPMATIMVVVGGLGYVVGAHTGNEKTGNWGRKVLVSVVIGLFIVYGSWVVVNTLLVFFVDPNVFPLPWNKIVCEL